MSFTSATDDFQKSRVNVIFGNCIKNMSFEKNQMFDVFKVARPVCSRLHFDLRKHLLKNHLSSKTLCFFFAFCTKKRGSKRIFFQNVVHRNAQIWAKNQFNIISALSEK